MRITVHRGTDQIGGCVTEYESNGWKLFVDYGEQLPDALASEKTLEIEGLTYGNLRKSALLITKIETNLQRIIRRNPCQFHFMTQSARH